MNQIKFDSGETSNCWNQSQQNFVPQAVYQLGSNFISSEFLFDPNTIDTAFNYLWLSGKKNYAIRLNDTISYNFGLGNQTSKNAVTPNVYKCLRTKFINVD